MDSGNDNYKIEDVAAAAGVTLRTIRVWVARGALPKPQFQGWATHYNAAYLARARAVRALRDRGIPLDHVAGELDRIAEAARRARSDAAAASAAAAAASAAAVEAATNATIVPAPEALVSAAPPRAAPEPSSPFHGEKWERLVLLSGLELHVRATATPIVRRLAEEILAQFGVVRRETEG